MEEQNSKQLKVKCPHCGLLTFYTSDNAFRPFCSERCQIIDLGAWASEAYKIPASASSDSLSSDTDEIDYDPEEGS